MKKEWHICVIETETNTVVETLTSKSERSAERVEDGININLNHDKYHTEVLSPEEQAAKAALATPPANTPAA